MLVLKRRLVLLVMMAVLWTSAGAMAAGQPEITLADRNGQQAAMTPFTVDGVSAWWAQLPPESGFDQLSLTVDLTGYVPGDGTPVDAPDAGESPDQAAYVSVMAQNARGSWQETARLYVSHSPYTPVAERSYRNVRAVGKAGAPACWTIQARPEGRSARWRTGRGCWCCTPAARKAWSTPASRWAARPASCAQTACACSATR